MCFVNFKLSKYVSCHLVQKLQNFIYIKDKKNHSKIRLLFRKQYICENIISFFSNMMQQQYTVSHGSEKSQNYVYF